MRRLNKKDRFGSFPKRLNAKVKDKKVIKGGDEDEPILQRKLLSRVLL
jgi:hypothetical protein